MAAFFSCSALAYLLIYAFEGVIRYGLLSIGASSFILARDALILVPLLTLGIAQARSLRVHPAFFVMGMIVAVHGLIIYGNFRLLTPAGYGAMLLTGELFGFIAAEQLSRPGYRIMLILVVVWVATLAGLVADKFVLTFPWVGLETHIGGVKVDVSHGWDITDQFEKRVAGFTRSSICAAIILPILGILIATRTRRWWLRFLVLAPTLAGVFLTTQKGSLAALAVVAGILLFMPRRWQYPILAWSAAVLALLATLLPVVSSGLEADIGGGVFSLYSLMLRIQLTWPDAWQWIINNQVFPLGVGLGGLGGAQRFYAQDFFNPGDNIFLFMYASFGVLALAYLAWPVIQAFRLPKQCREEALPAVSLLAFLIGYGVVLSLLEDQLCALFLGAAAGMLWLLRRRATGGRWSNPYSAWAAEPDWAPAYRRRSRPVAAAHADFHSVEGRL